MTQDDELERFKQDIDLRAYAEARGYDLDRRESSVNCAVMRSGSGDKIVIIRRADEKGALHWLYFSIRDDRDNGTVIDFVQNRDGASLGAVRQKLRGWTGSAPKSRVAAMPALLPVTKDRESVLRTWSRARVQVDIPYLTGRGLGPALLGLDRFAGRVRVDHRSNALFPHYDHEGLCGFEIKNRGFTGFASGGSKGLWYSQAHASDRVLVLTESAIDALSFHALHPDQPARYMSTGGALNPRQPALLRGAMEKMEEGSVALLAFDDDDAGASLADEVAALAPAAIRTQRTLPPLGKGSDWNDVLRREMGLA